MSDGTKIQWTDASWNPVRAKYSTTDDVGQVLKAGWHCERVSPGCQNCYAERLNEKRFGTGLPYNRKSRDLVEVYLDEKALTQPLRWRRPRKVFVCSMTDLFGEWVPFEMIDRVFAVMALSKSHTFQVLTKRPERMREYLTNPVTPKRVDLITACMEEGAPTPSNQEHAEFQAWVAADPTYSPTWPLPNVWLGVSAEDQERADQRIPALLATPAAVRFVSAEPLLGPLELERYLHDSDCWLARAGWEDGAEPARQWWCICNEPREDHISWVIVGGESGGKARPCDLDWIRDIVRQCQAAGVAVFVKQLGAKPREHFLDRGEWPVDLEWCGSRNVPPVSSPEREPDWWAPVLSDRKGGDPEEWPEDLRVREMPEVAR